MTSLRYSEKDEFLDRVYRKGQSQQSRKSAKQALDRFAKYCLDKYAKSDDEVLNDVKHSKQDVYRVLDNFVAYLQRGSIASSVIHVWMSWLKAYLGYCDIELSDNKFRAKVSMPKILKRRDGSMTRETAARILSNLPKKLRIVCMLEATSLRRPHEIIRWRVRDFDFDNKPTMIGVAANIAKNDSEAETNTTTEVTSLLKDYISTKRLKADDLLFPYVSVNSLTEQFRDYMEQLPDLNQKIEGTNRYKIHLYSFKKFGWTRASRMHGDAYADGLKGDINAHEYHRLSIEEKNMMYLQLEPELTFFNADAVKRELEDRYKNQAKDIEELKQKLNDQDKEIATIKEERKILDEIVGKFMGKNLKVSVENGVTTLKETR